VDEEEKIKSRVTQASIDGIIGGKARPAMALLKDW